MDETAYFKLNDLGLIAKLEDRVPYIFQKGVGWSVDNENLLMDRIMGYGDSSVFDYSEIPEKEALSLIEQ